WAAAMARGSARPSRAPTFRLLCGRRGVHEVKLAAGAIDDRAIRHFVSAFPKRVRAWCGFRFAHMKFEGCLIYVDAFIVGEFGNSRRLGLHILWHSELRTRARHAELRNCHSGGANSRPDHRSRNGN